MALTRAIRVAALSAAVLLSTGCKEQEAPPASRAPPPALSASAPDSLALRPPPQPPLLQGRLRCDATVALDARSELKLGGPRRYTLDSLRAEAGPRQLVDARITWTLLGSTITLKAETLYREPDARYRVDSCEATTKVEWRSAGELVVPSDIVAQARSAAFTRDQRDASTCFAKLPAGHYRVTTDGGEMLARRDDPEGAWAFLLAPDAGVDFEAEAKRLSGFGAGAHPPR